MKHCPFCAEEIQEAAIVCRFCNRDLPGHRPSAPPSNAIDPALSLASSSAPARRLTTRQEFLAAAAIVMVLMALLMIGAVVNQQPDTTLGSEPQGVRDDRGQKPLTPQESAALLRGSSADPRAAATQQTPLGAPESRVKLALLSARGYEAEGGGYYVVEGQVRNISAETLRNVTAVSTWVDGAGEFITSDDAIIDYNPILPGQTSPFKTMSTSNPTMKRYSVEFKELMGGSIEMEDRRRKNRR